MAVKSRVVLEVGGYNKPSNFAVIGTPAEFYIWYKPVGQKGESSEWFSGRLAFRHFGKMRELLLINKDKETFISYLTDLYLTNLKRKQITT